MEFVGKWCGKGGDRTQAIAVVHTWVYRCAMSACDTIAGRDFKYLVLVSLLLMVNIVAGPHLGAEGYTAFI